jgi:hypothetical protein
LRLSRRWTEEDPTCYTLRWYKSLLEWEKRIQKLSINGRLHEVKDFAHIGMISQMTLVSQNQRESILRDCQRLSGASG